MFPVVGIQVLGGDSLSCINSQQLCDTDSHCVKASSHIHHKLTSTTMDSFVIDWSKLRNIPHLIAEEPSIMTPTRSKFADLPWESLSPLLTAKAASLGTKSKDVSTNSSTNPPVMTSEGEKA